MGGSDVYVAFRRVVLATSRLFNVIGSLVLCLMMLLVVLDVSMRFLFNRPVEGSFELVEFMMAALVCLGMAYCGTQKGHVAVEFLVSRFSRRAQAVIDSFNYVMGAALFFLISWKGAGQAGTLKESGSITTVLELPLYPFLWILAGCSCLLGIVFSLQFLDSLVRVREK
ncbi:MAG: TRAP transporter small permease [Deltaproteobacteria bacterium]|nr:TRAP transporter small permease [Deltaproteobacteria bacterium]